MFRNTATRRNKQPFRLPQRATASRGVAGGAPTWQDLEPLSLIHRYWVAPKPVEANSTRLGDLERERGLVGDLRLQRFDLGQQFLVARGGLTVAPIKHRRNTVVFSFGLSLAIVCS